MNIFKQKLKKHWLTLTGLAITCIFQFALWLVKAIEFTGDSFPILFWQKVGSLLLLGGGTFTLLCYGGFWLEQNWYRYSEIDEEWMFVAWTIVCPMIVPAIATLFLPGMVIWTSVWGAVYFCACSIIGTILGLVAYNYFDNIEFEMGIVEARAKRSR